MRKILLLLIVFHSYFVHAQFGIVQDKDGFVNVREEENTTSKILQKINNGTVLAIDQEVANSQWVLVEYEPEANGYVFHDRIKKVEDFQSIDAVKLKNNSVNFEINDLKILIETKKFDKKNHIITKEGNLIYAIDGEEILGTDGTLPNNEYHSFKIYYQDSLIEVPNKFYKNLYNIETKKFRLTYNKDSNQYYLFGTFSDGAATYDAIWVIQEGRIIKHIAQINFYA